MKFLQGTLVIALSFVGQVCIADDSNYINTPVIIVHGDPAESGANTSTSSATVSTTQTTNTSARSTQQGHSTTSTQTIEYWIYGGDQVKLVSSNNATNADDRIIRDHANESAFTVELTNRVITKIWSQGQPVKDASGACPAETPITVSVGDSQEELMAACGQPDYINKLTPTTYTNENVVTENKGAAAAPNTTKEKDNPSLLNY